MKTNLFEYPKILEVLIQLYKNNNQRITEVAKKINSQHSYISRKLGFLRNLKLIKTKKIGRSTFITLTDRGQQIGKRIYEIDGLLK